MLGQGDPSAEQMEGLIRTFDWAERLIVAGAALLARLPGRPNLAAQLLRAAVVQAAPAPDLAPAGPPSSQPGSTRDAGETAVHSSRASEASTSDVSMASANAPSLPASGGHAGSTAAQSRANGVKIADAADKALLRSLVLRQQLHGRNAAGPTAGASERHRRLGTTAADDQGPGVRVQRGGTGCPWWKVERECQRGQSSMHLRG